MVVIHVNFALFLNEVDVRTLGISRFFFYKWITITYSELYTKSCKNVTRTNKIVRINYIDKRLQLVPNTLTINIIVITYYIVQ